MKKFKDYGDVLSIGDIQELLGIGRNMACQLVKNGDIKSKRVGNRYLIPKIYVLEFINVDSNLMNEPNSDIVYNHGLVIEKEAC